MEQQTFIELLLCAKLCSQLCEAPKVTRYHSHLGDIFGKVTKVHRSQLYTASNQPSLCSLMVGLSFPLCPWRLRCDLLGSHRWSPDSNPVSSVCWCETFGQTWRKPRLPHLPEGSSQPLPSGWEFPTVTSVNRSAGSPAHSDPLAACGQWLQWLHPPWPPSPGPASTSPPPVCAPALPSSCRDGAGAPAPVSVGV